MEWTNVSYALRGKRRTAVLRRLDHPKTATRLAKELGTHRSTVSRILTALERRNLVRCLDPDEAFNRFYERTDKGEEAVQVIRKVLG